MPFKPTEMQFKLIQKISEPGMDSDRLTNFKICAITLFIITVKLSFQGQKTQECGMQWGVVIRKWTKIMRLKDVILELKVAKIDKVLLFINWENCTILWDLNFNLRLYMHFSQI